MFVDVEHPTSIDKNILLRSAGASPDGPEITT